MGDSLGFPDANKSIHIKKKGRHMGAGTPKSSFAVTVGSDDFPVFSATSHGFVAGKFKLWECSTYNSTIRQTEMKIPDN